MDISKLLSMLKPTNHAQEEAQLIPATGSEF